MMSMRDIILLEGKGVFKMNYKVIDRETYYRKDVFRHFSEDCKCSTSMTARIDVTDLVSYSKKTGTKFYLNFLYVLTKVLNSREDYRMGYLWQTDELICYDVINPAQYVFHEDTETCTPVYTEYNEDYEKFYAGALRDPAVPVKVEYTLTERALTVMPLLDRLLSWSLENFSGIMADRQKHAKE